VVMTHGWWQACAALNLPAYSPYSSDGSNVNLLVSNRLTDRVSGAPGLRAVRCRLAPVRPEP
jgi:hypothetical protein